MPFGKKCIPNDRHILLGQDHTVELDSLGQTDDTAGNGNYVFCCVATLQGLCPSAGQSRVGHANLFPYQKR